MTALFQEEGGLFSGYCKALPKLFARCSNWETLLLAGPDQPLSPPHPSPFPTHPIISLPIRYQQLSTKAASTIMGRVLAACGCAGGVALTPAALRRADEASLRAAGLSARKVRHTVDRRRSLKQQARALWPSSDPAAVMV